MAALNLHKCRCPNCGALALTRLRVIEGVDRFDQDWWSQTFKQYSKRIGFLRSRCIRRGGIRFICLACEHRLSQTDVVQIIRDLT